MKFIIYVFMMHNGDSGKIEHSDFKRHFSDVNKDVNQSLLESKTPFCCWVSSNL